MICHSINFDKSMVKIFSNSLLNMFAKNFQLPSSSAARISTRAYFFAHPPPASSLFLPARCAKFSLAIVSVVQSCCCAAAVLSCCCVVVLWYRELLLCCRAVVRELLLLSCRAVVQLPSVPWLYKVLSLGSLRTKSVCSESKGAVQSSVHAPAVSFPLG